MARIIRLSVMMAVAVLALLIALVSSSEIRAEEEPQGGTLFALLGALPPAPEQPGAEVDLAALSTLEASPTALSSAEPAAELAAAQLFARLNIPVGITTNRQGTVYVVSAEGGIGGSITAFQPDGRPVARFGAGSVALNRITVDNATGLIWSLLPNGVIHAINPATGSSGTIQLQQFQVDVSRVYDVEAAAIRQNYTGSDFRGFLNPASAAYNDLAILRRGTRTDILVTGLQGGATSFVLRLRVNGNQFESARVIAASSATTLVTLGSEDGQGIAVNSRGVALTTLPLSLDRRTGLAGYNRLFAFSVDFPEQGLPPTALYQNVGDLISPTHTNSLDIASDEAGNFFIATGFGESPLCALLGQAQILGSPVMVITRRGETFCLQSSGQSYGVAASPDGKAVYLSTQSGAVLRYGVNLPAPLIPRAHLPLIRR